MTRGLSDLVGKSQGFGVEPLVYKMKLQGCRARALWDGSKHTEQVVRDT